MRQRGKLDRTTQLQQPGSTDLLTCFIKTWVKAKRTRLERLFVVKLTPLGVVQFRNRLRAISGRLSRLIWNKGNVLYVFLLLVFRKLRRVVIVCRGFACFNWHSFAKLPVWMFFLWMFLTQMKVLDTQVFSTAWHNR